MPAPDNTVDLWVVPLDVAARWEGVLPPDDVARASRFRSLADQTRSKASRAALRLLIGRYLGVDHGALTFGEGADGKPFVDGVRRIEFNLAHSQTTAIIAVSTDIVVGVDIEPRSPVADQDRIARDFFSDTEAAMLARMDQDQRGAAFLRAWTRKEAIAKAAGLGIYRSLDTVVAPPGPADGLAVAFRRTATQCETWYVYDVDGVPGHVGALAASRRPERIRRRELN